MLFPMGLVEPIIDSFRRFLPAYEFFARPLDSLDPSHSIGVYPSTWTPQLDSKIMGGLTTEPIEATYVLNVQNLVIHGDEIEGRKLFSADVKSVRAILYRDQNLWVALGGLQESLFDSTERVKSMDVVRQEYLSSALSNGFNFLGTTEVHIRTETSS